MKTPFSFKILKIFSPDPVPVGGAYRSHNDPLSICGASILVPTPLGPTCQNPKYVTGFVYVCVLFQHTSILFPGASNKLGEWLSDWVLVREFLHGLAQECRPRKKRNLMQR